MEKELSIEQVRELFYEKYAPKNAIQRRFPSVSFKEYEEIKNSDYKTKEQTLGLKIGIDTTGPITILTLACTILFTFPFLNRETTNFLVILYLICFVLIPVCLYNIFFNNKVVLTTNSTSFTFGKQTVLWDKILITGIVRVHGGNGRRYLVLGLSNGEMIKIDTDKSAIGSEDLIRIIHLNRTLKKDIPDNSELSE